MQEHHPQERRSKQQQTETHNEQRAMNDDPRTEGVRERWVYTQGTRRD